VRVQGVVQCVDVHSKLGSIQVSIAKETRGLCANDVSVKAASEGLTNTGVKRASPHDS
jgi:hypothetical protein